QLIDTPEKILWSRPNYPNYFSSQKIVTASYTLTNPMNFKQPICIISVDFSEKGINELLERRRISNKHHIAIVNENLQIISISNYNNGFKPSFFANIPFNSTWNVTDYNNEKYMTLAIPISKTPWELLYIINLNTALEPIAQTRNFLIILSIVMIIFLVIVS